MKTNKLIAAAVAASLAVAAPTAAFSAVVAPAPVVTHSSTPFVPWAVFGCAGGIILAALAANYRDNRQLTTQEAWTCGLFFLFSQPKKKRN